MLLILMVGQTVIAADQITRLTVTSQEATGMAMKRLEQVTRINTALAEIRASELGYVLSLLPAERSRYGAEIVSLRENIAFTVERYHQAIDDPVRLADYEAFLLHIEDYRKVDKTLVELVDLGGRAEAQGFFTASQPAFNKMLYHIHRLSSEEASISQALSQMAVEEASRARYFFIVVTALAALGEIGLGYYIFYSLSGGLGRLLEGTRRVTGGDLSHRVAVVSRDEFGELTRSFNSMVASLQVSQEENLRLTRESLQMREEHIRLLKDSLRRVVRAQEEERQRVARELHDEAGQSLTALQMGLARLEREAGSPQLRERVVALRSLAVATMDEVHRLALDLRPSALDELGLIPALRGHIREFSQRIGLPIEFQVNGEERRLPAEAETALFRVVQEGLTNVLKHSQAHHAWVAMHISPSHLVVTVRDDGVGFEVEKVLGSSDRRWLGLFGIRERVELLGGSLQVQSQPGQGTTLTVSVPLDAAGGA